ncbi:TrbM/KikA/MpfK family conjugal transfer protein [Campylobacter insulaenigrae]|uniref:TrbM/KikA/MpfK family conjugal transfer protein n=1 Tax=Campylobacter insulaenigrae TaxID=260714 RepID=UPI0021535562|nr:TrbM/KikA/MpfK family conjugal transfer protein [Campylobacter insulaenigrae]MCR6580354.1 TrbM/KikA/MpfK family conjugal transfer protein [Campylobacter insulaenigrae]
MKKIILSILFFGVISINSANAINLDVLSGDKRLACEALLCLASPVKPPECASAIAKYFSIHFKKPWKTIQGRKNFLNLCPVDNSDTEMFKYKNDILAYLDGECSVAELNKRIERKLLRVEQICKDSACNEFKIYGYRINPELTKSCYLLQSSAYTSDYDKFNYTCSKDFIEEKDWKRGYKLEKITEQEYNALPENLREKYREKVNLRWQYVYYKKNFINKQCWVNNNG